jgi:hypothetical protein
MSKLLKTSLVGKINNLPQFKGEALLPVFEAVANSIQAIEELPDSKAGKITIEVRRDDQLSLDDIEHECRKIVGYTVVDNGIGFNDINYDSFLTSDTIHKLEKGCKGVGRFFWLKAFDRVEIESVYCISKDQRMRRVLSFDLKDGIPPAEPISTDQEQKTVVRLIGFKEEYRKQPSAYKTTKKIAQRILEHCLSYYIGGNAPSIFVKDEGETISLDYLFDQIRQDFSTEEIIISRQAFRVTHLKLYDTHNKMHNIALCANSREVKAFNISKLLNTTAQFDEKDNKFIYSAYVSGKYLDDNVNSSRIEFDIPERQFLNNRW